MQRPRCGNPDLGTVNSVAKPVNIDKPQATGRSANGGAPSSFSAQPVAWQKKDLKWFIEVYPKLQQEVKSPEQIRRIMQQAFNDWEKYSGLRFEMAKSSKEADLRIKFNSNDHGDGYPFDGRGITLAHAFFPRSGEIHLDDDEQFTDDYIDQPDKYTLRLVAAHEIGHALGLGHTYDPNSLMFSMYQQFPANYNISTDDQGGIQSLYGTPEKKVNTKAPTQATTISPTYSVNQLPANNWCTTGFQTACEGPNNELYLFKDQQVWRYRSKAKRQWDSKPRPISHFFSRVGDGVISACVKSSSGYTYLFRSYHAWKLKTPITIEGPDMYRGNDYLQNPRVALFHKNSIYLIRHHVTYRINEFDFDRDVEIVSLDTILHPPPRHHIDAGFTYGKQHYVFANNEVYVYDSTTGNLLSGYPKAAGNGWFACGKSTSVSNWSDKKPGSNYEDKGKGHRSRRPPPPPPPPPRGSHSDRHRHHRYHHYDD